MKVESRLHTLFNALYSDSLTAAEPVIEEILSIMPGALEMPGAMEYSWSRLDRIGVKTSEDGQIRIFTWHVMDTPDTYRYFGYIQLAQKRENVSVFPLMDNLKPQRGLYLLEQSAEDWYGKLCYGIVTTSVKRKTYYTLLGMDFNDSRSNMKIVEVVTIHRNKPQFVKQMFYNGRDRVDRVVLEYSDEVAISVRYDPNMEMIVYDHLVPLHPIYKSNFEFYGPDGSFEGLKFEDGSWTLREDIDARMPH
ncbi:MAG: hypothetical protein ABFS10_12830 [Bacteroidota bacterium]